MSLIDKIKNTFFYDDDEEVKKEVIKVEIPAPVKEKEEIEEKKLAKEEMPVKEQNSVFFDEEDFENLNKTKELEPIKEQERFESKKELYRNNYKDNYRKMEEKTYEEHKKFKPTPVISPVYGVLDKNYHKEDIVHKNEEKVYKDDKGMTIDDLRNKAYGTLEDELENTLCGKKTVTLKQERQELLEDLELEMKQTADAIDLLDKNYDEFEEKQSENYEPQHLESKEEIDFTENKEDKNENIKTSNDDLFGLIDTYLYQKEDK